MARYNMTSDERMKLTNIKNLKKKVAIIAAINFTTLALDIGMTYFASSLQVNQPRNTQIYKSDSLQSILNAIIPACYALGAIGDNLYLTNSDGFVDTVSIYENGKLIETKLTDVGNDVSKISGNWYWLLLHLTKSVVRTANFVNLTGNPTLIDGAIENFNLSALTKPLNKPKIL